MLALNLIFLTFSAILFTRIDHVTSHGRLINPPQRSSAFRYGYNTPANYNDNQLFCGGVGVQYGINNGNCGACGDPYNADVKPNEDLGGLYVTGVITGTYVQGGQITAEVQLTAYHKGWFEFRLCPLTQSSTQEVVTQSCLDQHLLSVAGGTNTRIILNETYSNTGAGYYSVTLQLPADVHCDNCVLQWKYNTGNSWGCFPNGGQCCVGCGPQENFINCADIRINPSSTTTSTTQSTSSSSQSATMSALTSSTTVTSSTSSSSSSSTEETTSTTTTVTSPTTSPTTTVTSPTTASTTTVTSPTTSSTTTVTSPTTSSTTTVTSPTTSSATTTTTQAQTTTTNQSSSNYGPEFTCSGGLICAVSNTYLSILTMPAWCCSVCEHTPPYCPASHCSCH